MKLLTSFQLALCAVAMIPTNGLCRETAAITPGTNGFRRDCL